VQGIFREAEVNCLSMVSGLPACTLVSDTTVCSVPRQTTASPYYIQCWK